jgi:hypothetical protein
MFWGPEPSGSTSSLAEGRGAAYDGAAQASAEGEAEKEADKSFCRSFAWMVT